jgi:hypothetical protein
MNDIISFFSNIYLDSSIWKLLLIFCVIIIFYMSKIINKYWLLRKEQDEIIKDLQKKINTIYNDLIK